MEIVKIEPTISCEISSRLQNSFFKRAKASLKPFFISFQTLHQKHEIELPIVKKRKHKQTLLKEEVMPDELQIKKQALKFLAKKLLLEEEKGRILRFRILFRSTRAVRQPLKEEISLLSITAPLHLKLPLHQQILIPNYL